MGNDADIAGPLEQGIRLGGGHAWLPWLLIAFVSSSNQRPRLRHRSVAMRRLLVAVVGKGAVCLSHAVRIFAALDRRAGAVGGIQQFAGQFLGHGLARAGLGRREQPANRQRHAPLALDLNRHLVGRATDAAGLDLDDRRRIGNGLLEDFQRVAAAALLR